MDRRFMITLFSTNCPKCKVLEQKLNAKNIKFNICNDIQEIIDKGFMTVPILKNNDEYLEFSQAIKWVNQYEN